MNSYFGSGGDNGGDDCVGGSLFSVILFHSNINSLLPNQGIFSLPHHISMVWEELVFDEDISYTQWENGLQHS